MDQTIQQYRRKMAVGDGSIEEYLHLLTRIGISTGEALSEYVSQTLSNYHRAMVKMHLDHEGSANFSGIGTFKAIPAAETIRVLMNTGLAEKCLIVTPAGMVQQWLRVFEEHAPELSIVVPRGKILNKALQLSQPTQVFVTSYSSLSGANRPWMPGGLTGHLCFGDLLCSKDWDITVIDEVHRIKEPKAKRSKFCYALGDKSHYKIALTACPILNKIEDIWGVFRFINPEFLGTNYYQFLETYFTRQSGKWPRWPSWKIRETANKKIFDHLKMAQGIAWRR